MFYKQLVAWSCDGSSVASLIDYMNNPIYQELIDEDDYNDAKSDKKVYLDLRASSGYTNESERLERITHYTETWQLDEHKKVEVF